MVKYIFKSLLTRISFIRKLIKVKILNRKRDLSIIDFLWILYTDFSKTTLFKIFFLTNKILLIVLGLFSFITAYIHDLSWFNLALLSGIIITKLISIYSIIFTNDDSVVNDTFDPFIYASMAMKSLSDSNFEHVEVKETTNDDTQRNIAITLAILVLLGGLTYYQWDTDLITTLKSIVVSTYVVSKFSYNKMKDFIVARFSVTRDDDNNPDNNPLNRGGMSIREWEKSNSQTFNTPSPYQKPKRPERRGYNVESDNESDDGISLKDGRLNVSRVFRTPEPTNTSTTPSYPSSNTSTEDVVPQGYKTGDLNGLDITNFDGELLTTKYTYNIIRSILKHTGDSTVDLPDFKTEDYSKFLLDNKNLFDKNKNPKPRYDFNSFRELSTKLINNKENNNLYSKIINDSMEFDKIPTPSKIPIVSDNLENLAEPNSTFGKNLRGMFNKKINI